MEEENSRFPAKPLPVRLKKYYAKLQKDKYDSESWIALIDGVFEIFHDDINTVRHWCERLLSLFPQCAKYWARYAQLELDHKNFGEVERIFGLCLDKVVSVELFSCYLDFIQVMNDGNDVGKRATVQEAFEFALSKVGMDMNSGELWINYIKSLQATAPESSYEEQQKMAALRSVFDRAVTIPLVNVETIWKEYDAHENNVNKMNAKRILSDRATSYMTARASLRELKSHIEHLDFDALAKPPRWTKSETVHLDYWKRYIAWERSNPLKLEDLTLFNGRVTYAFKRAMQSLYNFPEIHFEAAKFYQDNSNLEEAEITIKAGVEALPNSFLLRFYAAELAETQEKYEVAKSHFEGLAEYYIKLIETNRNSYASSIEKLKERYTMLIKNDEMNEEEKMNLKRERESELEKDKKKMEERQEAEIQKIEKIMGLVWIMYMRFSRRAEGIKSARQVFTKARKSGHCSYHVFIYSALMEFHCSKDAVIAGKIFELGLKNFPQEHGYVFTYLKHLLALNDENNARSLFERSISILKPNEARELWNVFGEYENNFGDLTSLSKLEKRTAETFPNESQLDRLSRAWSFMDINVIGENELGLKAKIAYIKQPIVQVKDNVPIAQSRKITKSTKSFQALDIKPNSTFPMPDVDGSSSAWASFVPPATPQLDERIRMEGREPTDDFEEEPQVQPERREREREREPLRPAKYTAGSIPIPDVLLHFLRELPEPNFYNGVVIDPNAFMQVMLTTPLPQAMASKRHAQFEEESKF